MTVKSAERGRLQHRRASEVKSGPRNGPSDFGRWTGAFLGPEHVPQYSVEQRVEPNSEESEQVRRHLSTSQRAVSSKEAVLGLSRRVVILSLLTLMLALMLPAGSASASKEIVDYFG